MRFRGALVLLLLPLALLGCGEREEPFGDLSPYPVSVPGAGVEPAELEERPERIVALAPGGAELVAALGAGERLLGVPTGVAVPEAPDAATVVRPSGLVETAAVAGLAPDLLVADSGQEEGDAVLAERQAGAAVYVQPTGSLRAARQAAIELGLLVGEPVGGRRLSGEIGRAVASVQERVGDRPARRVVLVAAFGAAVPAHTLAADLVRQANGELVEAEAAAAVGDPCAVLELEPDLVLQLVDAGAPPAARRSPYARCEAPPGGRPRLERVPAELVSTTGPRVGEALEQVARLLHRDAF